MVPFLALLLLGTCPAFIHADKVDDWLSLPSFPPRGPLSFPPWRGSSFLVRPSSLFFDDSGWDLPQGPVNPPSQTFPPVNPPSPTFPWNRLNSTQHPLFPRFSDILDSTDHLFKHLFSPRPFPSFPNVRPFSPFPTVRPFKPFPTMRPFPPFPTARPFPPFPTVRPLFDSKTAQLSTFWEDLLNTPEQDQDWPSTLILDQDWSTPQQDQEWLTTTEPDVDLLSEATTNKQNQDFFNHEFSFHLHGDPFTAVVGHVGTFQDDIIDQVSDTVSPLLSFFNKFLDCAIGLDDAASDTENQDPNVEENSIYTNPALDGELEEVFKNVDSEMIDPNLVKSISLPNSIPIENKEEDYEAIVIDPAVVEHTGLPQINLDENVDNNLPIIDIVILDPNVEKHIGLPNSILIEDTNVDYEAQVADPAVIQHGDLPQINIDENLDNDLTIMDIDEVVPNMEDENSETLASGVAEHTGMTELMQLLDNVQDFEDYARNDSPQINDSAQQTQPGSGLKEGYDESSNIIKEDYNLEPIIHLIP